MATITQSKLIFRETGMVLKKTQLEQLQNSNHDGLTSLYPALGAIRSKESGFDYGNQIKTQFQCYIE